MSDSFDEFQPVNNEWDEFAVAPGSGPSPKDVARAAVPTNPDQAAAAAKLAKKYNAPDEVLLRNLQDVQVQDAVNEYSKKLNAAPVLADYMRKSPFVAKQSHDDIDALTQVGQFFSDTAGSVKAGVFNASRGAAGVFRSGFEFVAPVLDVLEPVTEIGGNPLRRLAEGFDLQAQAAGATAKASAPKVDGILANGFQSGIQSLTQNALALPLAFAPGGQGAALSVMTASTGGNAYQDAREKGLSMSQALPYAASQASIEWATEKLPLLKLVGDVKAGTPVLQTLMRQVAAEVPGEQVATILQDMNEWAVLNPTKPFSTYLEERPSAAAQTLIATIVGVGGNVTVSKGIEAAITRATRTGENMQDAEANAQRLAAAMQAATASKLRERNPETFQQLVQHIAENTDGAPQSVYIDAQVLAQSGVDIATVLPGVVDQLDGALAANSFVEVPIAEALANLPGTPLEQVFLQNARSAPDALSLAEAEQAGAQATEYLKQEADRVLQQAQDQSAWQASSESVKTTILDQLNQAGRFTPEVNEAYATLQMHFFSTMAARVGITPQEMYDRFSVKVAGASQATEPVLNAGGKPGEISVEGYHFSMADRPTLSTEFFGRGLKGSARDEIMSHPDERIKQRLSFYVDLGKGILPETGVGGRAHRAQLTNIYDSDLDPLKLRSADARAFESKVLDAGFSGYLSRMGGASQGQVILLGKQSVQPELLGPKSRIEAGQRAPALPVEPAKWEVQASGEPSMLQAKLERMQSNPSWAGYDMRVEGRELQVRKKGGVFEQSLSSRLPSAVKATEDPLTDVLNITYDVVLSDAKTLAKNVAALQDLPNMRKLKGKGAKDPVRNVEAFIDHVTNNLLWLHDHMPAEMRDRARLWYDGGRKTVEAWAKRYGISEMQGAAAIAVLSPQNGWFANVSQAERIADMVFGLRDYVWDDAMTAEGERISPDGVLDDKMQAAVGKSLGELLATPDIAARWARVYDQAHNNRAYRVLTPEGGAAEYVKTGAGADATMMWKSYSTIAKAISVLTDGRAENVHYQIGKEHKVRNFYNNIFDPDSPFGYATIDTHAVAAALLRPLASADVEVAQAFGGAGSASSAVTGLNGTYPIYLEAYRRAAEARGIQPRQMQSITWEAVRGLFEATAKRGMKAPANAIWERYKAGEIDQGQAQQEILALAGDITPPAWVSVPFNDTVARTYEGAPQIAVDSRPAVEGAESKVMFEVAPDPNDTALTEEWNALTSAERLEISQRVAARVVPEVLKELGTGGDFVLQLGGYLGATNPSMTLRLERPELALTAAKMLGHALSQDSMMVVAETPFVGSEPVGVVTLHLPEGYGETEVSALYDRLWQLKNEQGQELVGGHTTSDGQMVILNYSGLDDADLAARIDAHLGGEFAVDIDTVYSAFPSKEDYGYGDQRQEGAAPASQSPAQRRPSDLRTAATESLRAELDARRTARAAAAGASTQGQVNDGRLEQAGDRGAGRSAGRSLAPLEGAPSVPGFQGPDPRLVAVAEQYARDNGIDLKRQAEFVEVDPERAARIAAAYEAMEHAPNDPAVREAYENLIQQTRAQYDTLVAAGYKFWFMDLSREDNQQYASSPWNAMRDIRANQSMGVFPTNDGFGSGEDFSPEANPLLANTGLQWPVGGPDGPLAPVLANDLFRAVHDAFGHGLEGAGFRARGEENAWQAHVRLFTGSAVGAITSETRGQNSWLNYGPYGEKNRNAAVEDTVFAEQKTGLMPEWTWTEGRAGDMQEVFEQGPRGTFNPQSLLITLNENANLSTFLHESGHFFLEVMADLASQSNAPAQVREDMDKLLAWFGIKGDETVGGADSGVPLAQMPAPEGFKTKVVGKDGKPLVVYHGTTADIAKFDPAKSGSKSKTGAPEGTFFFTDKADVASSYTVAWQGDFSAKLHDGANVMPVYVEINKPLKANAKGENWREIEYKGQFYDINELAAMAKESGKYDGVIVTNVRDKGIGDVNSKTATTYIAFNPEQIVSALTGGVLAQDGNLPTDNTQPVRRTPLETWNAMTLDQKRPYHEKFAESFEAYLLEGKAPSQELQPLFRRFRSWLVNVYKSLKEFMRGRDLNMNDEVRQVFDRMLATDEQIAQAEETAGMLPDFDATNEAIEKLQARSLRDLKWTVGARSRALKALQKEAANLRKAVEAEVRAEVDDMPVYQAQAAIDRIKGDPSTEQLETIAEATGFTSASQMLAEIANAGTKESAVEGMTDQRMLERHGDLSTPEAIEQAANEAVHNEARARALATELKGQAEALNPRQQTGTDVNGRPITVNALVAAAKNFAENLTSRRKVKDLKNAARQHRAAEARAGKAWQQATAKGKTQEAVQAKRDQLLNNYAAKSMQEAEAEIGKLIDYFKKFDKDTIRKKLPVEYLDQIDALLENMDLRTSVTGRELERRASLRKWVESQQALGLDPIVPDELMENAQRVSYKEMTVDELRAMRDVVKNIEHLGRLKGKLLAAKDKREFDAIAEAWANEIRANGGKPLPVKLEGDGRLVKFFKGAWADHRKLNSLVRQMSGSVDNGEGFKVLIRSMNERGTQEDVMIEKASIELAKIHAPIEKLPGGFSGAKLFIPEINNSLSRAGRLAVALNWGNEQNRQRVRDGDNWTDAQVEAILRTLTPVELKFVNDVWAYLDSYWPEIKAKQERVSGVVEDKVEAEPFEAVAADGTVVQMRGGYYPIKYDGDRSLKSQKQEAEQLAKDMLRGAILRPATRRGHTKARVDEVVGRPVKKDLSVITQHVTQVVHDLAWHEWAIDANRLMNDPRIASAIRDHYGAETHRAMTDAIEAIVVGDVAKQNTIDQLLLKMRANVTRSIMGASLTTALLQPFGLTQSMARIGVVPVLKGAGRWAGDALQMESTIGWVNEKSDFMRLRSKTFNRELREISQRVQGKSKIARVADASLFMLMQKMQLVADIPTWVGQYEKSLNEGADEATAVQLADEAVLSSQGGGNTRDLSAVQRDMPFLTQFYSYFNSTLQLVAESTAKTDFKNPRAAAGWLGDMVLLTVIPSILPALITYLLKGGGEDDEPEEWAKRMVEWQAGYLLGMFVGLRELPALWSPFDYGGPPAAKLINDGRRLVQQVNQGEIDDPAVLATIGFLGTALGLPTTQIVRSYKGWKAWDEGDAPASSILFGPPPKD